METAPLTRAHTHARNAVKDLNRQNLLAASEEHELAAGEFSSAAKGTQDTEALRLLNLLEQHHLKLSEALRSNPAVPGTTSLTASTSSQTQDLSLPRRPSQSTSSAATVHRPTPPPSTIASNLASARGIPSLSQQRRGVTASPSLSVHHAGGRILSPPARPIKHRDEQSVTTSPSRQVQQRQHSPSIKPPPKEAQSKDAESQKLDKKAQPASNNDEPFQRFYSTFESLLSRISIPLLFAGLPLHADSSTSAHSPTKTDSNQEKNTIADSESAVTSQLSEATLRALRNDDNKTDGPRFGNNDSFYVVPTTGGTISYAGIVSRAEQEVRRKTSQQQAPREEDEFVDARETPQPHSPLYQQKSPHRGFNNKTLEELQLENMTLKNISDKLSRQLHMWEMTAQTSSLALQQSLRTLPPASSAGGGGGASGRADGGAGTGAARTEEEEVMIRDLEEQVRSLKLEMEKLARENVKLKDVVGRYREKWETLKKGARARREGTGTGMGTGTDKADDVGGQ